MKKSVAVIFGAAFLRFGTVSAADATNVIAAADSGGGVRIVVEASRLDSPAMEMPQFVEVVSSDGIAKSGARDKVW